MNDNLSKYYKKAVGYPLSFAIIVGVILAITHDGSGYRSEWSTDDGFGLTVFLTIGLSIIIAGISASLFFNRLLVIRANGFYSFTTWIIPAALICIYVIYEESNNFSKQGGYVGSRILDGYIMSVVMIHLSCLFISYYLFRKSSQTKHSG